MNARATAPDRVRDFVARVATHFDDLRERERAELLDDLEEHLLEVASEGDDDLDAALTSPQAYAAELRRSAGLPERQPTRAERLRALRDWPRTQPAVMAVLDFLPQLRPAWWLLRAWVVTAIAFVVLRAGDWWEQLPVPGRSPFGLLTLTAAVVLSVRIGLGGRDGTRPGRVVDALLGLAAAWIALVLLATSPVAYVAAYDMEPWAPPVLRHPDGEPITNLYLFDLDGNPIEDVLVYDGLGRPVETGDLEAAGFWELDTNLRRDRSGTPLTNLYPLEQYTLGHDERGGTRGPRPRPRVVVPPVEDTSVQPAPEQPQRRTQDPRPAAPGDRR